MYIPPPILLKNRVHLSENQRDPSKQTTPKLTSLDRWNLESQVVPPETAGAAEGRNPGLGRNAGTGQNDDMTRFLHQPAERFHVGRREWHRHSKRREKSNKNRFGNHYADSRRSRVEPILNR